METYTIPIDIGDIRNLIKQAGDPCVSIYLDLASTDNPTQQNPLRLKNLLRQATRLLQSRGMSKDEIDGMLSDLYELMEDRKMMQDAGLGLALFASPGYCARFELVDCPMEQLSVNSMFMIRPLLELMAEDQPFHILAVSLGEPRLFEADRHSVRQLDLGNKLETVREQRIEGERAGMQQHGGSGEGTDSSRHFGHGEEDRNREKAISAYLKELGGIVDGLLAGSNDPLLLAGEESVVSELRPRLKHANLHEQVIDGNPRDRTPEQLQASGLQILESKLSESRMAALEEIRSRQAIDGKAVADDLQEIMDAARSGAVDTLYITVDCRLFGGTKGLSEELRTTYAGADLANLAAMWTIEKGGKVIMSTAAELGEGIQMLAGLRY